MTWVRLEVELGEHPKIARLTDKAFRVHIHGLCYGNRLLTDGIVPRNVALTFPGANRRSLTELVTAAVWHDQETICPTCIDRYGGLDRGDYVIHDFLDYQPSAAEVIELRRQRSEAGRRGGQRSGIARRREANAEAKAQANAEAKAEAKHEAKSNPSPSPGFKGLEKVSPPTESEAAKNGTDPYEIKANSIPPNLRRAIRQLAPLLTDADAGTIGRLVNLAKRGAPEHAYHDARNALGEMNPRPASPSRYACHIVEQSLKEPA